MMSVCSSDLVVYAHAVKKMHALLLTKSTLPMLPCESSGFVLDVIASEGINCSIAPCLPDVVTSGLAHTVVASIDGHPLPSTP